MTKTEIPITVFTMFIFSLALSDEKNALNGVIYFFMNLLGKGLPVLTVSGGLIFPPLAMIPK